MENNCCEQETSRRSLVLKFQKVEEEGFLLNQVLYYLITDFLLKLSGNTRHKLLLETNGWMKTKHIKDYTLGDGHALRNPYGKEMGMFLANFKRGRGDYAGIAGKLNDGAMITDYIYNYPPNDFGLYNMAGNVNEWVYDTYRPTSFQVMNDLNPLRRDGFLDKEDSYKKSELSLIDDNARVYKGGSWADVAYWMSPGTRRYLDKDSCTATLGFRCAMIRAGTNY